MLHSNEADAVRVAAAIVEAATGRVEWHNDLALALIPTQHHPSIVGQSLEEIDPLFSAMGLSKMLQSRAEEGPFHFATYMPGAPGRGRKTRVSAYPLPGDRVLILIDISPIIQAENP